MENSDLSNPEVLRILLIEDNLTDVALVKEMLKESSTKDPESPLYDIICAGSLAAAGPHWKYNHDLVLLNLSLPDSRGMATFMRVQAFAGDAPIVVLSGLDDYPMALEAVRKGAQDYLVKWQMDFRTLSRILQYAIQRKKGELEILHANEENRKPMGDQSDHSEVSLDKRRLSERLVTIGQLATGVVHELNNPLSLILGFTQSMIRHPDPVELLHTLKSIERETIRCRMLIQQLLVFSRYRKEAMSVKDPKTVVETALALVETQVRTRKVKLEKHISEVLPYVNLDTGQLQQAIVNLCTNAIDSMPEGGTLSVGLQSSSDEVQIQVKDTGDGIPQEIQRQIFDPFFTTKETGKGVGLGLSIVHDIVERHHGHVDVESEPGKGSTFTLRLPVAM